MAGAGDKKLVRSKSGLRMVCVNERFRSPFELEEPPWIPDNECLECMECHVRFDLMKRRHHCRRCGKCFCNVCCGNSIALPRMAFVDPVRVCGTCVPVTRKENEFFDKHIKVLMNGAHFLVSDDSIDENENETFLCKLTQDHRHISFEGGENAKHPPIQLDQITAVQIITSADETQGLTLKHKQQGQMTQSKLMVSESHNRKQSMTWLASMQKAMKMIHEARGDSES
ncbi:zinc finger FYVE domain-containing protein 21-like isoform X2 [Ptychodera flava]|uniref:zinc finger FYVE domain-containing protein 21-like isoform X2 n=1 Tax=Ptychodera flava TaxID=63121 RepID=UPI003969DFAB